MQCTIPSDTYSFFSHLNYKFCFPEKEECIDPSSGLLTDCGQTWNCNLMCDSDSKYMNPVPVDGFIDLQLFMFDFVSDDLTTPTATFNDLIKTEISSDSTAGLYVEIVDVATISSAFHNCYTGEKNVQTIRLDFQKILDLGHTCFNLKFSTIDVNLDLVQCAESQAFQIMTPENCKGKNLLLLEGIGGNSDCNDAFFGEGVYCTGDVFTYSNQIYIDGGFKQIGGDIEPTYRGKKKTATKVTKLWSIFFNAVIPPYLTDFLLCSVLSGESLLINGKEYSINNSEINIQAGNNMALPKISIFKECSRTYSC